MCSFFSVVGHFQGCDFCGGDVEDYPRRDTFSPHYRHVDHLNAIQFCLSIEKSTLMREREEKLQSRAASAYTSSTFWDSRAVHPRCQCILRTILQDISDQIGFEVGYKTGKKSVVKILVIDQDKICQISGNRTKIALKDKKRQ